MGNEDRFRYDRMVERALRNVVCQTLSEVGEKGLVEDHHFYITFNTDNTEVKIPQYLKERYPKEMTIVLQHQFYDLKVTDEQFSVTLSFNNVPEKLVIPIYAITIFADPSVNFALQFQPLSGEEEDEEEDDDTPGETGLKKGGEVISLDSFRKKDSD